MIDPVTAITLKLQSLNIPIDGVYGPPFVVQFRPEATQAQRDQANTLAASWDQAQADQVDLDQHPERTALRQAAVQAVQNNQDYLPIADTATASQVREQVKQLTQQNNKIIKRLVKVD